MTIRSRREAVTFKHSFRIRGIDRLLPAGTYEVITDEESIEGISFAAFRRIATMILVPGASASAQEMISIGSVDLADAQRLMRVRPVGEEPLDLDKHRGMAAQKATDLRRTLAEVENHARDLRDRQIALENQLLALPAETWPEAAAKARYALNLYAASLSSEDSRHRNLVAAIFDDFERLSRDA